jgi:uncharacterized coiled-coil protein SlyX
MSSNERRLDRIEGKIDKLSDVVVLLARAEERLITLEYNKTEVSKTLDDLDARVDELESIVDLNQRTVNSVHKVMWLGATAMAAGLLTYIKKGL